MGELHNSYVFWLYPQTDVEITENGIKTVDDELIFTDSVENAKVLIASGKKAMVITDGRISGTIICSVSFRRV